MKKILATFLIMSVLAMTFVLAMPKSISTYEPYAKNNGQVGKSGVQHLYLVEKDSDWNIAQDGAWGKLSFKGERFVFNGHGLEADTDYTLVNYDGENWPNADCIEESTTSDEIGNVHIAGILNLQYDKVWLVLSNDVDCDTSEMTGWTLSEYLFEYDVI